MLTKGILIIFSQKLQNFNGESFFNQGAFLKVSEKKWILAWGEFTWHEEPIKDEVHFFISDFYLKRLKKWLRPQYYMVFNSLKELKKELSALILAEPHKEGFGSIEWFKPDFKKYHRDFENIKLSFQDMELKKIVPICFEKAKIKWSKNLIQKVLLEAIDKGDNLHPYGFWLQDKAEGMVGLTPEVFFNFSQLKDQEFFLKTMALAGTASIQTKEDYLLDQKKDLIEHEYVVSEIFDVLKKWGDVQKKPIKEEKFKNIKHLKTDIEVRGPLKNLNPIVLIQNLIKELHPTPALGGYPKIKAHEFLKTLEKNFDRQYFGAPFGVLEPGFQFHSVVAIRNIIWGQGESYLFSGSGVVKESQLKSEWEELELKRQSLKENFGLNPHV